MSDKISSDATNLFSRSIKTFTNLLKEFPKNAAAEFVYDNSTIEKIGNAEDALTEMNNFFSKKKNVFEEKERNIVKESLDILSQLMDELPKDSEDEFLYDRMIHQLVEDARETITKLSYLFS